MVSLLASLPCPTLLCAMKLFYEKCRACLYWLSNIWFRIRIFFFFLSRFGNIHDLLADALMGFYNQDPSVLCVKENWKMGLTEFVERV